MAAFFAGAAVAFVLVGITADVMSARKAFRIASLCFAIAAFAVIL